MEIRLRVGLHLNSVWRQIREISNETWGTRKSCQRSGTSRRYGEPVLIISGPGISSRNHESWLWIFSGAGKPSPYARFGATLIRADLAPSPGRDAGSHGHRSSRMRGHSVVPTMAKLMGKFFVNGYARNTYQ